MSLVYNNNNNNNKNSKTKIMNCEAKFRPTENLGKWLCRFRMVGVGSNSIKCHQFSQWIHGRCSGVTGKLQNVAGFRCKRCVDGLFREVVAMKDIMINSLDKLECDDNFCYLGDLIGAGGGAEEASRSRVRCVSAKFRKLAPVTSRERLTN